MNSPLASIVIPTRNRPLAIERCLDALAVQTMPSGSFEVIVVDDGSEAALALEPERWSAKFDLKLVRQNNTGPAGARNRGVAEARGEFLAFTDDDCLPTPTWLEKLIAALRENPDAMVGGSTFNGLKNDLFAETSQLIVEMAYDHFNRDPANSYFFASNNMAMAREGFLAIGGFDRAFGCVGAEDRDFCDRWRMNGRTLVWARNALIMHKHPQPLVSFCKIYWSYGQGAFIYKEGRKARGSGTMSKDLGFHRAWPAMFLEISSRYPTQQRLHLAANLLLWQTVNAAGFFRAWCRVRFGI
jgi:glycosyltransferase involved in cell wall biosynthesis